MILISPLAYSQISQRHKPVLCSPLSEMLNNLKTNYGEKLEFLVTNQVYNDFLTKIVMYRNKETGSTPLAIAASMFFAMLFLSFIL